MSGIYHQNKEWANVTTPNPAGTASTDLTKLGIDGVNYNVKDADAYHDGDLATIAETGNYSDLSNTPTIPTKTSDLINDSDFVESSDLATVATSGSYNDLSNKPTIPAAQIQSDWSQTSTTALDYIKNKPTLATVAISGSYNDLSNKPTIPTVNNGTLTIQKNGSNVATFTANQSGNSTANITVPEVGETDTTNSTPYLYRASQNSGDRCYLRQLVGASFGVNQLVQQLAATGTNNGVTFTKNSDGSYTLNGTVGADNTFYNIDYVANQNYLKEGHVYFLRKGTSDSRKIGCGLAANSMISDYTNPHDELIKITSSQASAGTSWARIQVSNLSGTTLSNVKVYPQLIDLTQMFGTAIADNAYTMEQTTAGSGVAWLKSYGFFGESYYPYNIGSLESVKPSGKVCSGKNLWGGYKLANDIKNAYPSATLDTSNRTIYYTGQGINGIFIPTTVYLPNTQYTFIMRYSNITVNAYLNLNIHYTDGTLQTINKSGTDKNIIVTTVFTSAANKTIDHIEGAWGSGNTTLYYENSGIFEGVVTENDFESYSEHSTPISPIDLRGVPKLSGNDIVYDGDVMDESGKIDRKYGIIDLGTQNFATAGATSVFSLALYGRKAGSCKMKISNSYSYANPYISGNDKCYIENSDSGNIQLYFKDSSYTDTTAFKTAMSGVYLVYELATPTTEQTTPIQNPEIFNQFGWEQFIDDRSFPIPVGHNSEYVNLPDWLEDGYYKDFRQRVDETLPNAINALANNAMKVIAKNGEYDAGVLGLNDMPNCSLSLDKGTYLIMAWCYFTAYNIDTNKEYGCAICDSSNTILSYDGHRNRTESAEGYYGATSSTFILETITTDATVRKLRGYMCKSVTGNPIRGGIAAFKLS